MLSSIFGVGMAVESKLKEKKNQIQSIEDSFRNSVEALRRDIRDISDSFEDLIYLMKHVSEESGNKYFDTRFSAGVALLLLPSEMRQYVDIKGTLDSSICSATIKLNGLLANVVGNNPKSANFFIDFSDEILVAINSVLLEGGSYQQVTDTITSALETVSRHLRDFRGNR